MNARTSLHFVRFRPAFRISITKGVLSPNPTTRRTTMTTCQLNIHAVVATAVLVSMTSMNARAGTPATETINGFEPVTK